MTYVKRIFEYSALAVIVALVCLELAHWGNRRVNLISENTAMNLRQAPAAAITEEERALLEEISDVPAIRGLLESGESGGLKVLDHPDIMAALERYLDREQAEKTSVGVIPPVVFLSMSESENEISVIQISGSGDTAKFFKVYARDGWFGTRFSYENWDNERVRQSVAHHWWFSWLTANW